MEQSRGQHKTIVHALRHNARVHAHAPPILQWINNECEVCASLTYLQLWGRVVAVRDLLVRNGIQRGHRVMIAYPFGLDFLEGMLGCMLAGVIPCSVHPPSSVHSFRHFHDQVTDARAEYALTTAQHKSAMHASFLKGLRTKVTWLATDALPVDTQQSHATLLGNQDNHDVVDPNDIGLIQYTSGSTGNPKGVVLTHRAIVHNLNAHEAVAINDPKSRVVAVGWLPQYHDYGLFGFFLAVYTPCFDVIAMSPADFIQNPLLWANAIDKHETHYLAAPNFAYGLLAKRMKAVGRVLRHGDRLIRANIASEPIAPQTLEAMRDIGIPAHAIQPCYGLAETCVYMTSCLGSEVTMHEGTVSCGLLSRNEAFDKHVVVADDQKRIVKEGVVGEIFIRGPDMASGYWNKPMQSARFYTKLDDGEEYFGTGDLGKVVNGMLYVVGRLKELIILNGRNIYPTDLESTIQNQYPSTVRKGFTAAFQLTEDSVGIVLEILETPNPRSENNNSNGENNNTEEDLDAANIQSLISGVHGSPVGKIVVLKKGTVPKTVSGKIRRVETRRITMANEWDRKRVVWEWERQNLSTLRKGHAEVPMDLPTERLPSETIERARSLALNEQLLQKCFEDLRLHHNDTILDMWNNSHLDKSTVALQRLCVESMSLVEERLPTIVQFAHLVAADRVAYLKEGSEGFLSELLHRVFVLNWITALLAEKPELMEWKLRDDEAVEKEVTSSQEPIELIPQAVSLVGDKTVAHDPLFGALDSYQWMNNHTTKRFVKTMTAPAIRHDGETSDVEETVKELMTTHVMEAVWEDKKTERYDCVSAGSWVAVRSQTIKTNVDKGRIHNNFESLEFTQAYTAWRLGFVTTMPESAWVWAALLMPVSLRATPEDFLTYRAVSMYLVNQLVSRKLLGNEASPSDFTHVASEALGLLNKRWFYSMSAAMGRDWFEPAVRDPPTQEMNAYLKNFDRIMMSSKKVDTVDRIDTLLRSVIGPHIAMEKTWDENGLSSLASAALTTEFSEEFNVTLPPAFRQLHPTPEALKKFVKSSTRTPFPVDKPSLRQHEGGDENPGLRTVGVLQVVGIMAHILLLLLAIVPSYFLERSLRNTMLRSSVTVRETIVSWSWLPMAIPLFMFTYSIVMIAVKWAVVGFYEPNIEFQTRSTWMYLRWWFVDRGMDTWDLLVGQFVTKTSFGWLFFRLMGAKLDPTAKIEASIREFDLVSIGANTVLSHRLRCRMFSPWHEDNENGPKMRFRPIEIGAKCRIDWMVSPGARIGYGCFVTEQSVVAEGAQIPPNTVASGNPAVKLGEANLQPHDSLRVVFEVLKILWFFVEIYLFFGMLFVARILWIPIFLFRWRYANLFYWYLVFWTVPILAIMVSVLLKRVLIGSRPQGTHFRETFFNRAKDWICDYHYYICAFWLYGMTSFSRFWNIILKLHGLDVDTRSVIVQAFDYVPSKIHLIKIRRSFVSARLSIKAKGGSKEPIEIIDSSLGYHVVLDTGIKVVRSSVPPLSYVKESIYDDGNHGVNGIPLIKTLVLETTYLIKLALLPWTIVPSYEILLFSFRDNVPLVFAALGVVLALLTQCVIWTCYLRVLQIVASALRHVGTLSSVYHPYIITCWSVATFCFWHLLWGTPYFPWILKILGVRLEGRLLYHGGMNFIYDHYNLSFADRTVVDDAKISGHYQVFHQLTLLPTHVAGLLHPGATALAGTSLLDNNGEYGPWRFLQSHQLSSTSERSASLDLSNNDYIKHGSIV